MARRVGFPAALVRSSERVFFDPTWPIPELWLPRGRWLGRGGVAMHCFTDDYRQEFFWRRPEEGLLVALAAGVVTAPDFTVYDDDPREWASFQAWRSVWIAAYWAAHGVRVLPVVSFDSNVDSYVAPGSAWAIRGPASGTDLDRFIDRLRGWAHEACPELLVVFGRALPGAECAVMCPVVRRALVSSKAVAAQVEVGRGRSR